MDALSLGPHSQCTHTHTHTWTSVANTKRNKSCAGPFAQDLVHGSFPTAWLLISRASGLAATLRIALNTYPNTLTMFLTVKSTSRCVYHSHIVHHYSAPITTQHDMPKLLGACVPVRAGTCSTDQHGQQNVQNIIKTIRIQFQVTALARILASSSLFPSIKAAFIAL